MKRNEQLTTGEVAKLRNCTSATVRNAIARGDLAAERIGDRWGILYEHARVWRMRKRGRKPGAKR